jgi:predicted secreted acid phosphatase
MRQTACIGLLALAVAAVPLASAASKEPKPAPAPPDQIVAYHDSGEWNKDTQAVVDSATKSLKAQLKKKPDQPAIVFDIDDTLESTYDCAARSNFDRGAITGCIATFDQTPIRPAWRLLRYAQKKKIALFLVTGRPDVLRRGTRKQLKEDGLRGGYTLVTRPNDELGKPAEDYKTQVRQDIDADGFTTLVNVGDQKSDLAGGWAVKRFKLPNPMYFTP